MTEPMLVWGARDIAEVIGRTERQVQHMLIAGVLPARRIGRRWVAARCELADPSRWPDVQQKCDMGRQ